MGSFLYRHIKIINYTKLKQFKTVNNLVYIYIFHFACRSTADTSDIQLGGFVIQMGQWEETNGGFQWTTNYLCTSLLRCLGKASRQVFTQGISMNTLPKMSLILTGENSQHLSAQLFRISLMIMPFSVVFFSIFEK